MNRNANPTPITPSIYPALFLRLVGLLLCLGSMSNYAASTNIGIPVDDKLAVVQQSTVYSADKSGFSLTLTVQNNATEPVLGPLAVVVTSLCSPNVTLANASGTTNDSHPYRTVNLAPRALRPGAKKAGIVLRFRNPDRNTCTNRYSLYGFLKPIADGGGDQTVDVDARANLDGGSSSDPAGLPLRYQWQLINQPARSLAKLSDAKSAVAHFTPDVHGEYSAQLVVSNGIVRSQPATVTVTARPIGLVKLHVNARDPKGHKLHYRWRVSEGSIVDADAADTTYLLPPGPGVHFANVLVYNNYGGYTERRIALISDDVGTTAPAASSRPNFNPASPAGTSHSDQAYIMAWSGAGRYVNLPDAGISTANPVVSTLSTDAYGLLRASSPDFVDLNCCTDIGAYFFDTNDPNLVMPFIYGATTLTNGYQSFRSADPYIYGAQGSFIFGSAAMADGSTCGIDTPFFETSVTATATPLDSRGIALGAPVRVNRLGDYAVLYDARVAKIRLQCEGASPVTVPVQLDTTTGSGIARPAVFNDAVQPIVRDAKPAGLVATLENQAFGKFLSPNLKAPSDNLKGGDHFLAYKGIDTAQSACAYYQAIGAVTGCDPDGQPQGAITFDDWKRKTGMDPYIDANAGVQEHTATYIDQVDLNLTRRQHSIAYPVGGQRATAAVAAYVCNHLGPVSPDQADVDAAIDNAVAGHNLVACVAMDYGVGGEYVRFFGFAANGQLLTSINLDGRREKYVPGTCTVCHGGDRIRGKFAEDGSGSPAIGAHFLPYDVGNFAFSSKSGLRRQDQEEEIYQLNQNVLKTAPTESEIDVINGWYKNGHVLDTQYVPQAWLDEASLDPNLVGFPKQRLGAEVTKLYTEVNARYCRTCHIAMVADGTQDTEDPSIWFDGEGRFDNDLDPVVCGGYPDTHRNRSMPNSLVTFDLMWKDAAAMDILRRAKGSPCLDMTNADLADPKVQLPVVANLVPGVPQILNGRGGTVRHFPMVVPSGNTKLQISTNGGTGDVDFDLYQGSPAHINDLAGITQVPLDANCDPADFGTTRRCSYDLTATGSGNYYLVFKGQTVFKQVTLNAALSP